MKTVHRNDLVRLRIVETGITLADFRPHSMSLSNLEVEPSLLSRPRPTSPAVVVGPRYRNTDRRVLRHQGTVCGIRTEMIRKYG